MAEPIQVWHEYKDERGLFGHITRRMTKCGGEWYTTGEAPCELDEKDADAAFDLLPACEASDEDIVAVKTLLGLRRVSRCRTKKRGSWT